MLVQRDRDYARHMGKTSDDVLVFFITRPSACESCATPLETGDMITLRENKALCLVCAKLDDLEFLPSGDAALTRRACKLSTRKAIIIKWSRARKRHERQGTLVEQGALEQAKTSCAADAEKRQAKNARAAVKRDAEDAAYKEAFLAELKRLFPGCPPEEAEQITLHACEKHSGRVGRSAAAREQLDPEMIRLAVIAHIRHVHTGYDGFFTIHVRKQDARRMVQAKIERILSSWESAASRA